MILLALDTSANLCSAALFDCGQNKILSFKSEDIGRGHAERLMSLIAEVLETAELEYKDVGRIAAICGPGSFTGIRVGLATARGLALGLNIPVVGINALEAIAFQHNRRHDGNNAETPIIVALDAKRGEVFAQIFSSSGEHLTKPQAIAVDQVKGFLPDQPFRIAGSGVKTITNVLEKQSCEILTDQTAVNIDAIAKLAAQLPDGSNKPSPLYLRSADAKPQNNFAVARAAPTALQQADK